MNGATPTTDRFGKANSAYRFDGVDDYISVSDFPFLVKNFTYSAWMKVLGKKIHHQSFCAHGEGGATGETWNFGYNTTHKVWDIFDRTNLTWQISQDIGSSWTHVAVVYRENVQEIFVNGQLLDSRSIRTPIASGRSRTLRIGTLTPGDQQFEGCIDDVRIYNYDLSADEIQALYREGGSGL